jgi:hypothetical protein
MLGVLLAFVPASHALADAPAPGQHAAVEANGAVVVETAGAETRDPALEETLRELLGRLRLTVVFPGDGAPNQPNVARVRMEFFEGGILVIVLDESGRSPPVRRLVPRAESASLLRETVAHVVLGAVEPLVAEPVHESTNEDAKDSSKDQVTPGTPAASRPSATKPIGLSVGVRGGALLMVPDMLSMSLGGVATLRLRTLPFQPAVSLGASYLFARQVDREALKTDLRGSSFRGAVRGLALSSSAIAIDAGIDGGVDVVSLTPRAAGPYEHVTRGTARIQPVVGASVSVRAHLDPRLDLVLDGGLDIDLKPRQWVVATGPDMTPFLELSRLRPFVGLGFDFPVLGPPRSVSREGTP